jgi:hypothetical protein
MGMKALDVLHHVDFEKMSKEDKADLKQKLSEHKTHLKKSMVAVEKALSALGKKGRKKVAKKRA